MLDAFHMPLVDNDHNLFLWALVDGLEEILVTFINENLFDSWEEDVNILNVPIDHVGIDALLRKLGWLGVVHSIDHIIPFFLVVPIAPVCNVLFDVAKECVPCLVPKPLPSILIELWSEEVSLGACLC